MNPEILAKIVAGTALFACSGLFVALGTYFWKTAIEDIKEADN